MGLRFFSRSGISPPAVISGPQREGDLYYSDDIISGFMGRQKAMKKGKTKKGKE